MALSKLDYLKLRVGERWTTNRYRLDNLADTVNYLAEMELVRDEPRREFLDALYDVLMFARDEKTLEYTNVLLRQYLERYEEIS